MGKVVKMAKKAEKKEQKLMPGSEGGKYFPFARKGDVLLGIQPLGLMPGAKFGVEGTAYFGLRLRSAPSHGLFADEDALKKVVKFSKEPENLWDAWPKVTWEKKNDQRASTVIGTFIPGGLEDDGAFTTLMGGMVGLSGKLVDYLVELAGPENLIYGSPEIKAWLDEKIDPMVKALTEGHAKAKAATAVLKENMLGSFGMQAALLKKVYEANHGPEDGAGPETPEDDESDESNDD
jgi:hypothetical protein